MFFYILWVSIVQFCIFGMGVVGFFGFGYGVLYIFDASKTFSGMKIYFENGF